MKLLRLLWLIFVMLACLVLFYLNGCDSDSENVNHNSESSHDLKYFEEYRVNRIEYMSDEYIYFRLATDNGDFVTKVPIYKVGIAIGANKVLSVELFSSKENLEPPSDRYEEARILVTNETEYKRWEKFLSDSQEKYEKFRRNLGPRRIQASMLCTIPIQWGFIFCHCERSEAISKIEN